VANDAMLIFIRFRSNKVSYLEELQIGYIVSEVAMYDARQEHRGIRWGLPAPNIANFLLS